MKFILIFIVMMTVVSSNGPSAIIKHAAHKCSALGSNMHHTAKHSWDMWRGQSRHVTHKSNHLQAVTRTHLGESHMSTKTKYDAHAHGHKKEHGADCKCKVCKPSKLEL